MWLKAGKEAAGGDLGKVMWCFGAFLVGEFREGGRCVTDERELQPTSRGLALTSPVWLTSAVDLNNGNDVGGRHRSFVDPTIFNLRVSQNGKEDKIPREGAKIN